MLLRRLREFFGNVHDAAIGMRVRDPPVAQRTIDGLSRERTHEDREFVDLLSRRVDEVCVPGVVREKLSEDEPAHSSQEPGFHRGFTGFPTGKLTL
jgi:hypothetical protein